MNPVERLKVGQQIAREDLETLLFRLHYQKREAVSRPGEFAVRGGIFDIYPVTYRTPVRLEFEGDSIHSIRDFSPRDGSSLSNYEDLFLIPLSEMLERKLARSRFDFEASEPLARIGDLIAGDYVVHLKYGIGRFLGLKTLQIKGEKRRHAAIEYADREILYLDPAEPLERYIGGEGRAPRLTKLHGKEWERLKERTRAAVANLARDLLEIEARRAVGRGFAFPKDHPWQAQFEAEFPFEETPDQARAVVDVKRDLESPRPMDRLIAGDVGYGKTEVAMRAIFKAVAAGRQAALLVPTTVLAEQHYLVLRNRLKNFPVRVEVLSRFRSQKEIKAILASVADGTTDIVIGTHRLLSRDVHFKRLGLAVIDEEQRFGVRHKERLKKLRALVDVLTLTATPIPRTLYMSLVGVRDMSTINTPPKNRVPVETYVLEYDDAKVEEVVRRELARGGQVYFVHNRVQSIEKVQRHLSAIMPDVRFSHAHGQMRPEELEEVMSAFLEGRVDCLVCTNIIESGIDIPNVNTIIVNRADTFGLADLYQLRGRVGRFKEKRQAYAYFFVPKNWVLTGDAEKRLTAIERFTELGSGLKIALEDLEIRGAGNLLGHEQSGFIHAVGFDLYCRMLRQAVNALKKFAKTPAESAGKAESSLDSAPSGAGLMKNRPGKAS